MDLNPSKNGNGCTNGEPDVILHEDVEHLDAGVEGRDLERGDDKLLHVFGSAVMRVNL